MDSSADVTSDTHSPSDSDVGLDGALDSTIDSAAELAPQSLLVSGEIAQCDNLARIGLAPTPSNTGREPLCISAFLSCKTRQFIEFSSVSCNIHAAQMLILVNVSGLSMILYGVLSFGFIALPLTLPMLIGFSLRFWLSQQNMAGEASSQLPLRVHGQRQEVLFSRPQANQPIPKRPSLIDSHWSIFLTLSAYMLFGMGGGFMFMGYKPTGVGWLFITGVILFLLSFIPFYKLVKPWRQYFSENKKALTTHGLLYH